MGEKISLMSGLQISVMAMLIVFVTLYLISIVLGGFKKVFKEEKKIEKTVKVKQEEVEQPIKQELVKETIEEKKAISLDELEKDEDMMLAAMIASMEASAGNKETNYKIVSIKQL